MSNARLRTRAFWKAWTNGLIYSCVCKKTVEGLSVVAISYYAVSLAGYLLYPFASVFGVSTGILTATVALPILLLVWWAVRRIRARME